ncbi:MAG TPA: DUF72 domain-containing protein [Dehalococcoidia bacterium]|jgi:uncharacterized protein YecE (DUF72 family)
MPARLKIRVGTASWTDRSLIEAKLWYPPDARTPEARLRYYASRFDFVEVDSTYYSLEMEQQAEAWAANTPPGFLFDVKAFRLFTGHQTPPSMLPRDVRDAIGPLPEKKRNWYLKDLPDDACDALWSYFHASMKPLRDAGKLGAVIFQIPPWTMPTPEARDSLLAAGDRLEGYRVAIEFRNKYWLSDRRRRETLALLRENGLALVIVDEPQGFRSSVPAIWEVTDPALAVVRLHGRNAETWEKKGLRMASERFRYEYDTKELKELAQPVKQVAAAARETHVTFNNNYQDMAQRNADEFKRVLGAA